MRACFHLYGESHNFIASADVKSSKNVTGLKLKMAFAVRDSKAYNVPIKSIKCSILSNIRTLSSPCSCICKAFVEGIFIGRHKCGASV